MGKGLCKNACGWRCPGGGGRKGHGGGILGNGALISEACDAGIWGGYDHRINSSMHHSGDMGCTDCKHQTITMLVGGAAWGGGEKGHDR